MFFALSLRGHKPMKKILGELQRAWYSWVWRRDPPSPKKPAHDCVKQGCRLGGKA